MTPTGHGYIIEGAPRGSDTELTISSFGNFPNRQRMYSAYSLPPTYDVHATMPYRTSKPCSSRSLLD